MVLVRVYVCVCVCMYVRVHTRSTLISAVTRAWKSTAVYIIHVYEYNAGMCVCVYARARVEFSAPRTHIHTYTRTHVHDVKATLARHGGHDSMTSTGRVLFSKGDSTVAAPRGEIAKRHKQPEHVAIGLRNNEVGFGQCERASERNMSKGLARLRLALWMESIFMKTHAQIAARASYQNFVLRK